MGRSYLGPNFASMISPDGTRRTRTLNRFELTGRRSPSGDATNRMSLQRTVAVPVSSTNERAAGNRAKPRKVCATGEVAARNTAGVHWFGYRVESRGAIDRSRAAAAG